MALRRIARAVEPKRVERPGAAFANEDMPEMKRFVLEGIQPNDLQRLGHGRGIEEQQHDLRCGFGEEREVDAVGVDTDTERMCRTGRGLESGHVIA